jgi:hypothetical protein
MLTEILSSFLDHPIVFYQCYDYYKNQNIISKYKKCDVPDNKKYKDFLTGYIYFPGEIQ